MPYSMKSIFEQALLAQAAYAELADVVFSDKGTLIGKLKDEDTAKMSHYAAKYLADNFCVLNQQSSLSGYSGTLFARRQTGSNDPDPTTYTLALSVIGSGVHN